MDFLPMGTRTRTRTSLEVAVMIFKDWTILATIIMAVVGAWIFADWRS